MVFASTTDEDCGIEKISSQDEKKRKVELGEKMEAFLNPPNRVMRVLDERELYLGWRLH